MEFISKNGLDGLIEKALREIKDWVMVADSEGTIIYANSIVYETCKLERSDVIEQDLCMFIGVDIGDKPSLRGIENLVSNGKKFDFITKKKIDTNTEIYLTNSVIPIDDLDDKTYYICLSKDITEAQKLKEESIDKIYFDSLTNHPNKQVFFKDMAKEIDKYKKENARCAIIIIYIQGIERINSVYGIRVGNSIIKNTAKVLESFLVDNQKLYKYDSNSFVVMTTSINTIEVVDEFLKNVIDKMNESMLVDNINMDVEIRAGISMLDDEVTMPHQLIDHAQIALTKVKKDNRGVQYLFYSKGLEEEEKSDFFYEAELKLAIKKDEFIVYYQPFIDLKSNELAGMEALVRRRKSNGEIVLPGKFIGVLEKIKLIEKVGIQILEKVCLQLHEWMKKGIEVVPVSVNLSAVQFKNRNLAKDIINIVDRYNIPSKYIVLEITETTMMEDVEAAGLIIEELKKYGFLISIDDFGTGYASIGYLKKFMFDHLKIDISFIREITKNPEDRAIVEAIIAIARTFNLRTIAEGIESEDQLHIMMNLGCEMGQGYLWDKPITAEEIESRYLECKIRRFL